MSFNPLDIFRPRTEAEAAARVKNVQPGSPAFLSQVTETIGTIATAFGRTFGTVLSAPAAVVEGGANVVGKGIETVATPFNYLGKIMNTTRTKMYNVLGGHWFK